MLKNYTILFPISQELAFLGRYQTVIILKKSEKENSLYLIRLQQNRFREFLK